MPLEVCIGSEDLVSFSFVWKRTEKKINNKLDWTVILLFGLLSKLKEDILIQT